MEDKAQCGNSLYWHNCYTGTFDLLSPESVAHPAKMAPALCFRILQHLEELGLVKKGQDTILDPMGGTGMTNLCAGAMGYPSISVELEEKFVGFQKENKEYAERKLYKSLDWTMLKGDSRQLSSLLKEGGLKSVVSPPYSDSLSGKDKGWEKLADDPTSQRYGRKSHPSVGQEYSDNPDNIGNLKDMPLKSITSPPYQDSQGHPSLGSVNKDEWGKEGKDIVKRRGLSGEYGDADGQVGNLKAITSPPYEESLPNGLDRKAAEQMVQAMYDKHGRTYSKEDFEYQVDLILKRSNREYGESEGQIGKLKDKPLKSITSPPYGATLEGGGLAKNPPETFRGVLKDFTQSQGESEENIGNLKDTPLKAITSPPYGIDKTSGGLNTKPPRSEKDQSGRNPNSPSQQGGKDGYGEAEGQIGSLKDTPLKAIVSPPYGETGVGDWKTGRAEFQAWVINEIKTKGYVEWQGKRYTEAEWRAMNHGRIDGRTTKGVHKHPTDGYSDNPDNIGGLPDKPLKAITSPPYAHPAKGENKTAEETRDLRRTQGGGLGQSLRQADGYSTDKDNIGNLMDKPLKSIVSPPYEQSITGGKSGIEWQEEWGEPSESRQPSQDISYGESKENIGNLKDKPLKSIVSPPYAHPAKGENKTAQETRDLRRTQGGGLGQSLRQPDGYSDSEDNIGNLTDKPLKSIVSPPYGDAEKRDRSKEASNEKEKEYPRGDHNISAGYQGSDDNIGKLDDKPLKSVMSPPHGLGKGTGHADNKRDSRPILKDRNVSLEYNDTNLNNIGNQTNESYLEAMSKVYREISLVSDVLCVVVKNPTRGGKIRRLDSDTISILEQSGWKVHCQHRALLFEELEQANMFDGITKKVKGRLSFFKRLSYIKGQPVSSWEDIIVCVRK